MDPDSNLSSIPLESLHSYNGARLAPFGGYLMPVQYDGIISEHHHTRRQAGLFDVSHMGTILISGLNIEDHLEKLIPADLHDLALNCTKYTFLLNDQGGIEDDLLITRTEHGFQLVLNAGRKHHDLSYLSCHLPSSIKIDCLFEDVLLALQGPCSSGVMKRLCPEAAALPFMGFGHFSWETTTLAISRTGYTGEDGFEIRSSAQHGPQLFNWLLSQDEVKPCGLGARDTLRLEAGLCLYGHDLTSEITPTQANLSWALGKRRRQLGGFVGANKILSELNSAPPRQRIGFTLSNRVIAREGTTLHDESGQKVGYVTSGTHSPNLNCGIGMGYVETSSITNPLYVQVRSNLHSITIVKLPFVSHNYYRG